VELFDTLLANKQITADQHVAATEAFTEDTLPETALLQAGVAPEQVRTAMANYYGVPEFIPDDDIRIPEELLELIPEESARHYQVIPLKTEDGVLIVGVNQPDDVQVREVLNFISTRHEQPYKMVYLLPGDFESLIERYASLTGEVGEALTSLESELDAEIAARQTEANAGTPEQEHIEEDAPVTKIVATVLRYAVDGNASDIHIEPFQEKIRVRFRIDGQLVTNLQLPKNVQSAVVARVKILSSMRLDERRKPQDGRFSATFDGRRIDFRVSVLPTNAGEKVVMRILDSARGVHTLEDTGISPHNLEIMRRVTQEPYGIILISGPTGSGKSTTLYSILEAVDREHKNVLSLEDPVEYNIEGVAQSQVRPEIGYTFAAGLRSALRQDPDIILVGEIRDRETAQLAIQAALTGHLVFSTIHTNNSIGVVPRLIDMGIDPYLIAPTLKLAVAQRLARRICDDSGREMPVTGPLESMVHQTFSSLPSKYRERIPENKSFLRLEPTEKCPSGTKGRIAVTECLEVTEDIEQLILENASEEAIYDAARRNGFMSMKEDAIIKALEHQIPFEEVGAFGTKVGMENTLMQDESSLYDDVRTPEAPPIELVDGTGADVANVEMPTALTEPTDTPVDNSTPPPSTTV
jgi:type IV pilus assembly protein PilB